MMGIKLPETCWAYYKCNKPFSWFFFSTQSLFYRYGMEVGFSQKGKENVWRFKQVLIFWFSEYCLGLKLRILKSLELGSVCSAFHKVNNLSVDPEMNLIQFETQFFFNRFVAQKVFTVCTRINYRIVPVTNFNKYLHYAASESEYYVCKYRCK